MIFFSQQEQAWTEAPITMHEVMDTLNMLGNMLGSRNQPENLSSQVKKVAECFEDPYSASHTLIRSET